jgi:PIN domain nuclease of toxin-antitoxin system
MMTAKILDAYAILAFLNDEPGADKVRDYLLAAEEGKVQLAMSVINLGEVWYAIARSLSPTEADKYVNQIYGMPIEVIDADWKLTRQAASYKALGSISYADCFAAALAKNKKAEVITGDMEFKTLEGEIGIIWI